MSNCAKYSGEALSFIVEAKCSVTKARVANLILPHCPVGKLYTPVFMPVGTAATLKGVLTEQLKTLGCEIMLSNTYHLGIRPGADTVERAGGVHKLMNWERSVLTDSGGFQMVSLSKLSSVDENGVLFQSPYSSGEKKSNQPIAEHVDGGTEQNDMLLMTPEKSIQIQNQLGADIIMQLDDVVHVLTEGERVEEAMWRSIRWLDRCIAAHKNTERQNLFAIIQGGLQHELRKICCAEMMKRDKNVPGYAIGGLSGGEEKQDFWRVVSLCTDLLPENKPRYCMGVGYVVDLVVCVALGVDMFDCVFPTRTARFGTALVKKGGSLKLTQEIFKFDFSPIEDDCPCCTCKRYSRSYLNELLSQPNSCAASLLSIHNVAFQLQLMESVRSAVISDTFPNFIKSFIQLQFPKGDYPVWVTEALSSVGVDVK